MPAARILCVDDDPGVLLLLPEVLRKHGYEVSTAGSVPEALNIITSQQRFDVLISDLNMGHIADGFTVVHTMRRVNPQCVNFILTGYPAFESALQALRQQVDDYLTKPSDIPTLIETIGRKLQERRVSPPRPIHRLSTILRDNIDKILARTLVNLKANPELAALPLSDEERLDTLDSMIDELANYLDSDSPNGSSDALFRSAHLRGQVRLKQQYSLRLMLRKQRIIAEVINNIIYENLLSVNVSYLLLDLNKLNDTVLLQLEESIESYVQAERKKL
jgi:two-component system OmpR family response regulator